MSRIFPTTDELIAAWEQMLKGLPNYSPLVDENRFKELFNTLNGTRNFKCARNGVNYVKVDGDVFLVSMYHSFTLDQCRSWQFQEFDDELDRIKRVFLELFNRPTKTEVFIGKTKVEAVSIGNRLDFEAKIIINKDNHAIPRQQD